MNDPTMLLSKEESLIKQFDDFRTAYDEYAVDIQCLQEIMKALRGYFFRVKKVVGYDLIQGLRFKAQTIIK